MTPSFVFLFLSLSLRLLFVFGDDSFTLPQIEYADLVSMEKSAIYKLTEQFTFLGAIQIANIPKFTLARKEALEDLSECLHSDTSATKMTMKDGSIRYSAGAETKDGVRSPMSSSCGDASYRLRAIIDAVCRQVFAALDSQVRGKNLVMEPSYSTFTDLIANGNHLEHLHSYFPPQNQNSPSINTATMDFHTDAGLMIAMTTGYYSSGLPSSKSGLYISLPDRNVKVETKDDTLILMMGEGAKNWLKPVLGKPFRPVPHALIVDFPAGSENSRSWFGKMYLPPPDALLPVEKIPYSQYHQKAADYQSNKHQSPLACGGSSYSQIVLQNEPCTGADGSPGVFCWTQCMSVSELPCGQSAQCVSSSTGEVDENGKSNHCMDCALQCPAKTITSVYGSSSGSSYCYGDGTTMSMLGFFSVASDEKGSTPCVNLLFKEWTLDNETKMAFACLGVLALGIFIQYLTFLRAQTKNIEDKFQRQAARIIIFGVQVTLSYFLMLAAMTFSVELFCMVCVGLTIGFGLFHSAEPQSKKESKLQSCCPDEEGLERLTEDDGLSLVN